MPFQALAYAWRAETGGPLSKLVFLWLANAADQWGYVYIDLPRLVFFAQASEGAVKTALRRLHECPAGPVLWIMEDFSACEIILPVRSDQWDADGEYVPLTKRKRVTVEDREWIEMYCGRRCFACGSRDGLQVDHIIPLSQGGEDDRHNMQFLCAPCNRRKRNTVGWFELA
jgi:hypothetical protein